METKNATRQAAKDPSTPVEVLADLIKSTDCVVRLNLADNPNLPDKLLGELAMDKWCEVRECVARRHDVRKSILAVLAKDENLYVRSAVLGNPNITTDILEAMANDSFPDIRASVAGERIIGGKTLALLSKDRDKHVREVTAQNPNTPSDVLAAMAGRCFEIDVAVSSNPSTPPETLASLAKASYGDYGLNFLVHLEVAKNPNTPDSVLSQFADKYGFGDMYEPGIGEVCSAAALNPNSSAETLWKLFRIDETREDSYAASIRYNIARNLNTPAALLRLLTKDQWVSVSEMAKNNFYFSPNQKKAAAAPTKIPTKIGGVAITPEQQFTLRNGGNLLLCDIKKKDGTACDAVLKLDKKSNRIIPKIIAQESTNTQTLSAKRPLAAKKNSGMKL